MEKIPCDEGRSSSTTLWLQFAGLVVSLLGPILLRIFDRFWSRGSTPPREKL